jgi:predicted DsbA family dithiol-disulfide isomerase
MSPAHVRFGYWSDPLCIWAFVAQDKLDRLLAELGQQLEVDYHVLPVFGSVPWRFREGPWQKDGVDGRVAATRRLAEQFGKREVTGECWRGDAPASSWSPGAAIHAVLAAEGAQLTSAGSAARYQAALRRSFFVDGQNTAQRSVQLAVAEQLAIPREPIERALDDGSALAQLWEDHNERERLRLQGSPSYVFDGGRAVLYGNFGYGILKATVDELVRGLCQGGSNC